MTKISLKAKFDCIFRAGRSSKILVWQALVNLSNIGVARVWQTIVNLSNIGVAAATPATLVPPALNAVVHKTNPVLCCSLATHLYTYVLNYPVI